MSVVEGMFGCVLNIIAHFDFEICQHFRWYLCSLLFNLFHHSRYIRLEVGYHHSSHSTTSMRLQIILMLVPFNQLIMRTFKHNLSIGWKFGRLFDGFSVNLASLLKFVEMLTKITTHVF